MRDIESAAPAASRGFRVLIRAHIRLEGCGGRFVEPTRIETGTWSIVKGSWMRRSATGLREVERRNYPRTDVRIVVSYRGNDIAGGYDISESENISPGGMLLATSRAFPPGEVLVLTLRPPDRVDATEVYARVIGSQEIVARHVYLTRVQFTNADRYFLRTLGLRTAF